MSVIYAAIAYVMIWRRNLFLRLLDAEESFWMRLGLSKRFASFGRGFSESRLLSVSMAFFATVFLMLAIVCAYAYFYFGHRSPRG